MSLRRAVYALLASGFRDLEGLFYQVLKLAHVGDADRAVEILRDVVDHGFVPPDIRKSRVARCVMGA